MGTNKLSTLIPSRLIETSTSFCTSVWTKTILTNVLQIVTCTFVFLRSKLRVSWTSFKERLLSSFFLFQFLNRRRKTQFVRETVRSTRHLQAKFETPDLDYEESTMESKFPLQIPVEKMPLCSRIITFFVSNLMKMETWRMWGIEVHINFEENIFGFSNLRGKWGGNCFKNYYGNERFE